MLMNKRRPHNKPIISIHANGDKSVSMNIRASFEEKRGQVWLIPSRTAHIPQRDVSPEYIAITAGAMAEDIQDVNRDKGLDPVIVSMEADKLWRSFTDGPKIFSG